MSHYFSRKPISTGKTTIINTFQLGNYLQFKSQSGIFSWQEIDKGSELLIKSLKMPKNKELFLDLGCGYGFIGITLAKAYPNFDFILTDVNELAVRLARENCKLNLVEKNTIVKQGYLFQSVEGLEFHSVITNPPLMAGKKLLEELIVESFNHLKAHGSLQLVVPKKKGLSTLEKMLKTTFGSYTTLGKNAGFWALIAEK